MSDTQQWIACTSYATGDTLKWAEPLWAPPHKPRGKRDKIGEQEIIGALIILGDILELKVISVHKLSSENSDNVKVSVKQHDVIKRKLSSLEKGNCQKLVNDIQDTK